MGEVCMWGKGVGSLFWLWARPCSSMSCPKKVPARGKAAKESPWSSRLRQPASVASCQFATKAPRRRRDTRGGIKRASSQPPALPCLCLSFRDGRTWALAANHGAPRPAASPFESLRGSHLGLAIWHLTSGHLGALGFWGEPGVEDGQEKGAAGWGLRPPRRRVPGLSGQLDVTGQSQGGFVK